MKGVIDFLIDDYEREFDYYKEWGMNYDDVEYARKNLRDYVDALKARAEKAEARAEQAEAMCKTFAAVNEKDSMAMFRERDRAERAEAMVERMIEAGNRLYELAEELDDYKRLLLENRNLKERVAELEQDLSNKEIEYTYLWDGALALQSHIAELSRAVGLITTLKPTMVMDTEHPLDMAKEVVEYVTVRIAELEEVRNE